MKFIWRLTPSHEFRGFTALSVCVCGQVSRNMFPVSTYTFVVCQPHHVNTAVRVMQPSNSKQNVYFAQSSFSLNTLYTICRRLRYICLHYGLYIFSSLGPFYGSPLSRVVVVVVVDIDFTLPFTRCRYCRTPPAL